MYKIQVHLDEEIGAAVKEKAKEEHRSMKNATEALIIEGLKAEKKKNER